MTTCHAKWILLILLLSLGGIVVYAAPTDSEITAKSKPTEKVDPSGCVTDQCHAAVKKHKVIHGPVNVNACDACHKSVDVAKHTFKPTREKEKLCTFCHKLNLTKKAIHKPLKTGDCTECHDPHGGFDRASLKKKSMSELCASCHQDIAKDKKVIHGPVAAGSCEACHEPHQADHEKLLRQTGKDLCFSCHNEMKEQLGKAKFQHEPVQEDCQQCHNAHASNHIMMLNEAPLLLCTTSCHADIKTAISKAKVKHSAVTEKEACIHCHTAHGGELDKLMVDNPINICMKCHEKPVKRKNGTEVESIANMADPNLVKHGPLVQGSCGGCHNVHGSEVSRLLAKPYPETFYESFKLEKYDLCFSCHDKQLVLLPKTQGLTGFRNDDVNMHYLHVNKMKRGRSCRACHSTHTSTHELHIRESVPYGNWQMPINYKTTKTGGSCAPGCHQKLSYDRKAKSKATSSEVSNKKSEPDNVDTGNKQQPEGEPNKDDKS